LASPTWTSSTVTGRRVREDTESCSRFVTSRVDCVATWYLPAHAPRSVVLSRSHLARRWVALERRSAWLIVDTQVKACSRETHSPSRASKTCGHNAFQIIHIHTTVINSGLIHTTQHRTHCERDCGCNPG